MKDQEVWRCSELTEQSGSTGQRIVKKIFDKVFEGTSHFFDTIVFVGLHGIDHSQIYDEINNF